MAVGLIDRQRRLAQVVEVAQLMRYAGQGPRHGTADRALAIAEHGLNRYADLVRHLPQQPGEILGRG